MRNLDGLEMVCFCGGKHFELRYEGGGRYLDPKGEPIQDLLDMNCYVCTASYFTTEGDPMPFCPSCGHVDRKRFDSFQQIDEYLRGQDWSWLAPNRLAAVVVHTWDDDWQLKITRNPMGLEASGSYRRVRPL